ncbi:MAG TPA: TetR family transcriptional regulator [Lachnospiraceae bacterium]|nr:TetR family transcriptional regulator [Lachnospiraceae bacterium]
MGKVEHNKRQKRDSLLDSAFSLFIDNGFTKTSISDIVKQAGVAKGTFYLYFRDKYDIRNHLITSKANQVFQAAYAELTARDEEMDFEDQVLFMADHILNQLAANHNLVMLLSKHLSWGSFKNFLAATPGRDVPAIYTTFESMLSEAEYTYRDPELMMYLILELISGTSFNAILYEQPVPLEELKPHLYETVKCILKNYRED